MFLLSLIIITNFLILQKRISNDRHQVNAKV